MIDHDLTARVLTSLVSLSILLGLLIHIFNENYSDKIAEWIVNLFMKDHHD